MTEEKTSTDYANLAFNPYAISTDDLTIDDDLKKEKSVENHGFDGDPIIENNPHYEDTLEVAKKAGLTGIGRRKKENIIYEETVVNKKNKPTATRHKPTSLPPRPNEDWKGVSKRNTTAWRIPFAILCLLVLLCLAGSALGLLAYFDDKKCSCETTPTTEKNTGGQPDPNASRTYNDSKLLETIKLLTERIDALQTKCDRLEAEQKRQVNATERNVLGIYQRLNTSIVEINSTLTVKLNDVKSNVSFLTREVEEFHHSLRRVNNFTQLLSNDIDSINSSFSMKLANVSKQMGPRGYNGSEGIQGPPGIGNISACEVMTKSNRQQVSSHDESSTKAEVTVSDEVGYKIMAAVCTTRERYGAGQTALSVTRDVKNTYKCTCVGTSPFGPFVPAEHNSEKNIDCIIEYWRCPILT